MMMMEKPAWREQAEKGMKINWTSFEITEPGIKVCLKTTIYLDFTVIWANEFHLLCTLVGLNFVLPATKRFLTNTTGVLMWWSRKHFNIQWELNQKSQPFLLRNVSNQVGPHTSEKLIIYPKLETTREILQSCRLHSFLLSSHKCPSD